MRKKSTKDLPEVLLCCSFWLFGILQVTSSCLHFAAVSLKLAGGHRQFCFSSTENCFHVDKNLLALQLSTQTLPARDFISDYICVCQLETLLHLHLPSAQQRCMLIYVKKGQTRIYKQTSWDFFS